MRRDKRRDDKSWDETRQAETRRDKRRTDKRREENPRQDEKRDETTWDKTRLEESRREERRDKTRLEESRRDKRRQETRALKKLRSLEPWVTQLGRNGVLRPPKNRKWAHTVLGTLEPWFTRIDIDRNFRPSKCSQEAVCITTQQNSHFQAYKMQEMRSQEVRYLWYYDSAEILFWSPQNADKGLTRPSHSVEISFSGRQNA